MSATDSRPPALPSGAQLFETDDRLAARIRAVAGELGAIASRRRAIELAAELEAVARILDPAAEAAA